MAKFQLNREIIKMNILTNFQAGRILNETCSVNMVNVDKQQADDSQTDDRYPATIIAPT